MLHKDEVFIIIKLSWIMEQLEGAVLYTERRIAISALPPENCNYSLISYSYFLLIY